MKGEAGKGFPTKSLASVSARTGNPPSGLAESRKPHCRRSRSASRIRLRRDGTGAGGSAYATGRRSGGPSTPLLTWKFDVDDEGRGGGKRKKKKKAKAPEQRGKENGDGRWNEREEKPAGVISARMLAAGLWRLQPPEVSTSGGHGARRTIHRPTGSEVSLVLSLVYFAFGFPNDFSILACEWRCSQSWYSFSWSFTWFLGFLSRASGSA